MGFFKKTNNILISVFVIILAAVLTIAAAGEIKNGSDYEVSIRFLGEKNIKSIGNSVWISGFSVDDVDFTSNKFSNTVGWEKIGSLLHAEGSTDKEHLTLSLKNADNLKINACYGPDKGKLVITSGAEQREIDLYAEKEEYKGIDVDFGYSPHQPNIPKMLLIFILVACALICWWWGVFVQEKGWTKGSLAVIFGIPVLFAIFRFSQNKSIWALFAASILITFIVISRSQTNAIWNLFRPKRRAIFVGVLSVYVAIMLVGYPAIFQIYQVDVGVEAVCIFLSAFLYSILMVVAGLILLEKLMSKIARRTDLVPRGKAFAMGCIFFALSVGVFALWNYIFYPANCPADTITLLNIIRGGASYFAGHPYFYYLFTGFLTKISTNVMLLAAVQYVFFSAVVALWIQYLWKKGLSTIIAIAAAVFVPLIPSNGIGQLTIVKDYPHATALLLLTYFFVKLVWDEEQAVNFTMLAGFFATMILVQFLRQNGFLAFYTSAIILVVLAFRFSTKKRTACWVTVGLVLFTSFAMKQYAEFQTKEIGATQSQLESDTVEMILMDNLLGFVAGNEPLPTNITKELERYQTLEQWKLIYSPVSDISFMYVPELQPVRAKFINEHSTKEMVGYTLQTIATNPLMVLKNRLNRLNIVWSFLPMEGRQVYSHINIFSNNYDIEYKNPFFVQTILVWMETFFGQTTLRLFFQMGIWNVFLLLMALFVCIKKCARFLICYLPGLMNLLSLYVSCSWQDARYFYFVLNIAIFIGLSGLLFVKQQMQKSKF